jgi:hypothetical protein
VPSEPIQARRQMRRRLRSLRPANRPSGSNARSGRWPRHRRAA